MDDIITQSSGGQFQATSTSTTSGANVIGVVGASDETFDIDILKDDWAALIDQRIGSQASTALHVVEGAGHSITELLNEEVAAKLLTLV